MFTRQLTDNKQAKIIINDWSRGTITSIQKHFAIKEALRIMLDRANSGEQFDDDWTFDARFMAEVAEEYFRSFEFVEFDLIDMAQIITDHYHQELLILQQAVELSRIPKVSNWAYLTKVI